MHTKAFIIILVELIVKLRMNYILYVRSLFLDRFAESYEQTTKLRAISMLVYFNSEYAASSLAPYCSC